MRLLTADCVSRSRVAASLMVRHCSSAASASIPSNIFPGILNTIRLIPIDSEYDDGLTRGGHTHGYGRIDTRNGVAHVRENGRSAWDHPQAYESTAHARRQDPLWTRRRPGASAARARQIPALPAP